ncbi:MAG: hypothetical protein VYE37_14230, partial [Pseudomonadota bacterium]|nr:hypothetical protein [Pseudomonadota bacterium]
IKWLRILFWLHGENAASPEQLRRDHSDTAERKMPLTLSERHYGLGRVFLNVSSACTIVY